ncbi:MAG: hypothetical protein L6301_00860 [Desulfobacteraceae bacterium]|nr:hypothetical protein [Desulfobacteraceae bacterium]
MTLQEPGQLHPIKMLPAKRELNGLRLGYFCKLKAESVSYCWGGYWKIHHNAAKGKGTIERFIRKYNAYVEEV